MPKTHKKFTLATITLNNIQGVVETYNSVQSQTLKDYEWLVQDGGSTDETLEFIKTTPAITQSTSDNGIYDAMNRLIERSNGEYILFLNAGDTLATPQTLEIISKNLEETPDFIYGDALEHVQNANINVKTARNHKHIALGMFTHHQSMLYKTSCIGDLRYNETYTIAADYDFTARFLQQTKNVKYIPAPICIFEAGGISQQQTSQNNSNSSQGSDQVQNFFSKNFGTDLTNALSFK